VSGRLVHEQDRSYRRLVAQPRVGYIAQRR